MSFLAPIPALIAAAITLPALLILYFLKLRRRPIRVSSTLLWQQATHDLQVNVPFRWIRPTLMLLLHLLILACLLVALARPAVNMDAAPPAQVIFLIDASASMSATDMEQPRLVIAKQRALRTLDNLARGGQSTAVSIIAFAAEPRALTSFSIDRSAARAAINAIEPTDQPADLHAALRLAGTMLAGDADETGERQRGQVILFSDGVFAETTGYTLANAEFRYERIAPAPPVSDDDVPQAALAADNLGIVALSARRDWDDPGLIRIFARVQNALDQQLATTVLLLLDGREMQRRTLTIPAAVHSEDQSRPIAGSASVTFELATRESGIATVVLARDDILAADNSASVVLRAATKPRILLVVPDVDIEPTQPNLAWILTGILEEMELPYRRTSASAFNADIASREPLRADLILFDRVAPASLPPAPSISFGAGLPLDGMEITQPQTPQGTYFLSWQRTHPLLRHVSLDSIYIARPLELRITNTDQIASLARGRGGPLIALADGPGPRRVVVAFELAYSNWPTHFGFPIFIASAIDYLTLRGEDHSAASIRTSQPVRLALSGGGRLTLDGPRRLSVDVPAPRELEAGAPIEVSLGILDRAGIYRVGGEVPGAPPAIAVNLLSETESALAGAPALRVAGQSVAATADDAGPREVWHWFIAIALLLLAIEWFLSAWYMRA
jgi:hypothetical protein